MESLSSAIQDKLLGRCSTTTVTTRATGLSSQQGGEEVSTGVSQEIPVTSQETSKHQMESSSKTSKMDFSTLETALSLPFSIGRNKEKQTEEDPEITKLQQIQLELKQRELEKRNKAQLDANISFIWPTWNEQTITEHIKSGRPRYWLIPRASFSTANTVDDQPDFPMSKKSFLYKVFVINLRLR